METLFSRRWLIHPKMHAQISPLGIDKSEQDQ